jgi:hypothetical protein
MWTPVKLKQTQARGWKPSSGWYCYDTVALSVDTRNKHPNKQAAQEDCDQRNRMALPFVEQIRRVCAQINRTYGSERYIPILDPATANEYVILDHSDKFGNQGLGGGTAGYVKRLLDKAKIEATIEPAGDGTLTVRCKAPG